MDENAILAAIRQDVEVYDFDLDFRHIARHVAEGEFDEDNIVATVMNGEIIEPTPERNRWLFLRQRTLVTVETESARTLVACERTIHRRGWYNDCHRVPTERERVANGAHTTQVMPNGNGNNHATNADQ